MSSITLSEILDDIRAAEDGLHKFERRYWISSSQFYELYSQGYLDNGENAEDFSEWAGHYKLRQKRQAALETISQQRIKAIQTEAGINHIHLTPAEPSLKIS